VSHPQRLTLLAAILGSAVAAIDGSIVNVALPAIERDLGGGLSAQQWVSNAYLLTLGSLILIGGSLGDIYGERRVFTLGLAGFGVFSVACAFAPTIEVLIAARACQGAAAALLTPASLAIIVAAFGPKQRGAAIGSWTAWGGMAAIVGPLAGGWIVDVLSWRWIFALNVPLVVGTIVLVLAVVPRTAPMVGRRVDFIGAGLGALGLAGIVFALIEQPHYGWSSPLIAIPLAAGAVSLGLFLAYERRAPEPMLKLELFSRRNFAVGNLETLAMYASIAILFFYLTIYLQEVVGYSALESGLATVPVTIVMFMLSRRFGALADRHGPRLFMGAGPLIAGAGIFLLARMGMSVNYVTDLLPALLVFASGLTLTVAPLTATILADAEQDDAGIASAVNNAVARIAGLIGVSIVGIIVAGSMVGDTFAANAESVRAFQQVMMICGGLLVAAGVVGSVGITNPTRRVRAEQCPGGQFVGAPLPATGAHPDGAASAARSSRS
jgi:EmrB/QacA subfamily drug resistance transporter